MRRLASRTAPALLAALAASASASADVVTYWHNVAIDAIRANGGGPGPVSRELAMVSAAIFDAVNGVEQRYEMIIPGTPAATAGTNRRAAAASAAYETLRALYPGQSAMLEARFAQSMASISDGVGKDLGVAYGAMTAQLCLDNRAADGHDVITPYTPGDQPGQWRPTPPANDPAWGPGWGLVSPWVIESGDQFRPEAPPALDSAEYAASFNEVKELGRIDSATRTAEQTEIARFWANDRDGTTKPPGHWNQIAEVLSEQEGNTLMENARMYALLNVAMADTAVSVWDAKFHYNFWRPLTAIVEADTDGNDLTISDPTWRPYADALPYPNTPAFPAYTSGHATFGATAATILALFFGSDDLAFTIGSDEMDGVLRSFESLSQAAQENADSRVYLGVHWDFDSDVGLLQGQALAEYIYANFLEVPAPGGAAVIMTGLLAGIRRRR